MKDPRLLWIWVGIAVVVIVVVGLFLWKPTPKTPAPTGAVPVYASQGQLVPQFPKNLILGTNTVVSSSYSISYSSSTNQYTAEYDSSSTVTELFDQYKTYLPQNGWTISGALTTNPAFYALSASEGNNQLQVVINPKGTGSQVAISYVMKGSSSGEQGSQEPAWINVASSTFPPNMITGVLIAKGALVTVDHYYDDSTGAEHGEYAFEIPLSGQGNKSNLYSVYMMLLENNIKTDKQVVVLSQTSSSIAFTEPGYAGVIAFSNPNPQTALVDITYHQVLPK